MRTVTLTFYSIEDKTELGKGSYATEAQTAEEFIKELEAFNSFELPGFPNGARLLKIYGIAQVEGMGTALINWASTDA